MPDATRDDARRTPIPHDVPSAELIRRLREPIRANETTRIVARANSLRSLFCDLAPSQAKAMRRRLSTRNDPLTTLFDGELSTWFRKELRDTLLQRELARPQSVPDDRGIQSRGLESRGVRPTRPPPEPPKPPEPEGREPGPPERLPEWRPPHLPIDQISQLAGIAGFFGLAVGLLALFASLGLDAMLGAAGVRAAIGAGTITAGQVTRLATQLLADPRFDLLLKRAFLTGKKYTPLTEDEARFLDAAFELIAECVKPSSSNGGWFAASPRVSRAIWRSSGLIRGRLIEQLLARTQYKDWFHIGQEHGGFFPAVDFTRIVDSRLAHTSVKTLDVFIASLDKAKYDLDEHVQELFLAVLDDLKKRPVTVLLDVRVPRGTKRHVMKALKDTLTGALDEDERKVVTVFVHVF